VLAQAGQVEHVFDQFRQRQVGRLAQPDDQVGEGGQLGPPAPDYARDGGMQAAALRLGRVLQVFQAARADAAGGKVHHAGEGGVVVGVGDQAQVGQRMLDLGAFEEAQAAIDAIGQAGIEQRVFQRAALRVAAVEQGDFGAGMAVARQRLDFLDDEARFVAVGIGFMDADRLAGPGLGPQVLAQALRDCS
jgi:hypothetical protein